MGGIGFCAYRCASFGRWFHCLAYQATRLWVYLWHPMRFDGQPHGSYLCQRNPRRRHASRVVCHGLPSRYVRSGDYCANHGDVLFGLAHNHYRLIGAHNGTHRGEVTIKNAPAHALLRLHNGLFSATKPSLNNNANQTINVNCFHNPFIFITFAAFKHECCLLWLGGNGWLN